MVGGNMARPHARRKEKDEAPDPRRHIPPSKQYRRERCGAHARTTGKPCQRWAMANGRCMMHGGKSLWGKEHPSFKTGLRSRYQAETVLRFLDDDPEAAQALADMDVQGIDDEIRLAMLLLMMYLKDHPRDIPGDWCVRGAKLIDKVTRLKYRRHKMLRGQRSITLEQLKDIIRRFTTLIYTGIDKIVEDDETRQKLFDHIHSIPEQIGNSLG
jgi:hypothetical protein